MEPNVFNIIGSKKIYNVDFFPNVYQFNNMLLYINNDSISYMDGVLGDAYLGLYIFDEMAQTLGYGMLKELLATHGQVNDGQREINSTYEDFFYIESSKIIKFDLIPLFFFWKVPITNKAKSIVQSYNYPSLLPLDIYTQVYGYTRLALVQAAYPNCQSVTANKLDFDHLEYLNEPVRHKLTTVFP